jgi:hypothetical protein
MTSESGGGQVYGQARVTLAAGRDPSAGRAEQSWCVSASIQEYEYLSVFLDVSFHRLNCGSRNSRVNRVRSQINERHPWRSRLVFSPRQHQTDVAAGCHIVQGLERRGRRAEHYRDIGSLCTNDGEIARRIPKSAFMLLERRIVFFVHDDDPKVGHWSEHR